MLSVVAVTVLMFLAQLPPTSARPIDAVKALYASASDDEALAYVASMESTAVTVDIEQVRAFCLFALGRVDEARDAFDRMVRLSPGYQITPSDVSPRVFELFRETRRRVLPLVVRDRYARGKQRFESKQFEAAASDLREVNTLLDDPDLAASRESFADLQQLAEGFLRLSDLELQTAAKAAAAAAEPVARPAPPAADALIITKIPIYTREDRDVLPPVEIDRYMPAWNPPSVMLRMAEYRGTIEIVINEEGRVDVATIVRPTIASYDLAIIGATRRWRFEPALRQGIPVRFRHTYDIVIAPQR